MNKTIRTMLGLAAFAGIAAFSLTITPTADALQQITASLDIGSRGTNVTNLQTFLAQDSTIYPQGLITGYYGNLTAAAVRRFQARYGISTVGRVGPQTRAKINELIVSGTFAQGGTGSTPTAGDNVAPTIYNATSTVSFVTTNVATTTATTTGTTATTTQQTQPTLTISWQTSELARGKVYYSTLPLVFSESTPNNAEPTISGTVLVDGTYTMNKTFTVSNVASSTTYYYMIEAVDPSGNVSVTWPQSILVQ